MYPSNVQKQVAKRMAILMLSAAILSGCAGKDVTTGNYADTAHVPAIVSTEKSDVTSYDYPDLGISIPLKGKWLENSKDVSVRAVYGKVYDHISGLMVYYNDHNDTNLYRKLFNVVYADMDTVTMDFIEEMIGGPDRIADVQEIGKYGSNTFYFCAFPEDTEGLSAAQKEAYLKLFDSMDTARESLIITEPTYSPEGQSLTGAVAIPDGTVDLYGNPVSAGIFAENTLTMVNIWGSFCNPCIAEMPMLQTMNDTLKEKGVAIVGVLGDAVGTDGGLDEDIVDLGKTILEKNNVTYLNIAMNPELQKVLVTDCYPTSILIDANGNIVGDTIFGAQSEEEYLRLIEEALAQVGE